MSAPVLLVWGGVTGVGGTESRMAEVIAHWCRFGRRIVSAVLATDADSPLRRLLVTSGSEVRPVEGLPALARLITQEQPGLVMAFGLRASLMVRAVRLGNRLRRRPWPHTVDARNGLEMGRRRSLWVLDRWTQGLVDTFLANSDAAAANLVDHGLAEHRVRVLYSALGDGWQAGALLGDPDPASVVMVGNARPEKQQWLGLEVFARLPRPATLTVFTNDATGLRDQWRGLAPTARGDVRFCEGHSVTPRDLARAAIMLHPSSSESAPRCVMEARASGCYVVAFDTGDTRRIVADGGSVVPAGDRAALFDALATAVHASADGGLSRTPSHFPTVAEYAATLDALGSAR